MDSSSNPFAFLTQQPIEQAFVVDWDSQYGSDLLLRVQPEDLDSKKTAVVC